MREKQTTSTANKALIAVITLIITYFSIVSTFTNSRVSRVEIKEEQCSEKVVTSERNIAVILEKIRNIESMLVMIREEMRNEPKQQWKEYRENFNNEQ